MFSSSIHVVVKGRSSFFLLHSIPLCKCTIVFFTILPNHLGEMCVMWLKISADFFVFLKAMGCAMSHALNVELEPDSCSQMMLPITHFWGCTLACLQVGCLLTYQVNWSKIDGIASAQCVCECMVWCQNPELSSSACMTNAKNWGTSEKSIFMEGQCSVRRHSVPAFSPSDVALKGQCWADGWVLWGKVEMTPMKRCEGVNTIGPAFCFFLSVIVSFHTVGEAGGEEILYLVSLADIHTAWGSECWGEWAVTLLSFLLHSLNTKWFQILLPNTLGLQTNVSGWEIKIAWFESWQQFLLGEKATSI